MIGKIAGKEVIQLHMSEPQTKDALVQELVGFEKIFLKPEEEKKVEFDISGTLDRAMQYAAGGSSLINGSDMIDYFVPRFLRSFNLCCCLVL